MHFLYVELLLSVSGYKLTKSTQLDLLAKPFPIKHFGSAAHEEKETVSHVVLPQGFPHLVWAYRVSWTKSITIQRPQQDNIQKCAGVRWSETSQASRWNEDSSETSDRSNLLVQTATDTDSPHLSQLFGVIKPKWDGYDTCHRCTVIFNVSSCPGILHMGIFPISYDMNLA